MKQNLILDKRLHLVFSYLLLINSILITIPTSAIEHKHIEIWKLLKIDW